MCVCFSVDCTGREELQKAQPSPGCPRYVLVPPTYLIFTIGYLTFYEKIKSPDLDIDAKLTHL
jgi:hypothetical protein